MNALLQVVELALGDGDLVLAHVALRMGDFVGFPWEGR
jgi:hypothetical protein